MKKLIEYIATSLVDNPSEVRVTQYPAGSEINIELRVGKRDMGRVIGRGGQVANAMRLLLRVAAARQGKRANLDVIDPD